LLNKGRQNKELGRISQKALKYTVVETERRRLNAQQMQYQKGQLSLLKDDVI
jgi:hypothetical protein